jgi:hypothetical protein
MVKVRALLLGGLLLAPPVAHAQSVLGAVVESETGEPIADAMVELMAAAGVTDVRVRTDSSGLFLIHTPRPGTFTVRVTHPAFVDIESDMLTVGPGESLDIVIRMGREVVPLEPLVVTARRTGRLAGYYQRLERPGFARFVTREQIARRAAAATTDPFWDVPGVHIRRVRTTTGTGDNIITMRLGQCTPLVYIDGVQVRQALGSGMDLMLRPDVIEGVEIYTGSAGLPPIFEPHGCGVVAFWTRTGEDSEVQPVTWRRVLLGATVFTFLGALVAATR